MGRQNLTGVQRCGRGPHLVLAALLEDGDLLHKAVGREHGVQGVHRHRVGHVVYLQHRALVTSCQSRQSPWGSNPTSLQQDAEKFPLTGPTQTRGTWGGSQAAEKGCCQGALRVTCASRTLLSEGSPMLIGAWRVRMGSLGLLVVGR